MNQLRHKYMRILIIVFNHFINDTRVIRQAQELDRKGFEVKVLALHKTGLSYKEELDGYTVYRIPLASFKSEEHISSIIKKDELNINNDILDKKIYGYLSLKNTKDENNLSRFDLMLRKLHTLWRIKTSPSELLSVLLNYKKKLTHKIMSSKTSYQNNKLMHRLIGYLEFTARKKNYEKLAILANIASKYLTPNFVLANDFNGLLAAEKIYDEQKLSFAYDSHELWTERNRPLDYTTASERQWELMCEKRAIHKSSFNFTVCKSIAEHMAKIYNVDEPYVVRNTPNAYTLVKDPHFDLKRKLGLSDDIFLCIYIGKITYNRGVEDILNALPLVTKNIHFVTMGHFDHTFKSIFKNMVKANNIESRVHCVDAVPSAQVAQWASSADISIASVRQICLSYLYALPNKVFESLQAHLPIIIPNSPEFERIAEEFSCGIKYKDEDYEELSKKIMLLATRSDIRDSLVKGAITASKKLVWENERDVFLKPFDKVLNQ